MQNFWNLLRGQVSRFPRRSWSVQTPIRNCVSGSGQLNLRSGESAAEPDFAAVDEIGHRGHGFGLSGGEFVNGLH
jgi:hypothetical protein